MSPHVRRWRSGSTSPALQDTLLDVDGTTPVNLTGATVEFEMASAGGSVVALSGTAVVTWPAGGMVEYGWGTADLSEPGLYRAEWRITYSNNRMEVLPQGGVLPGASDYLLLRVTDDVDD